MKSLDIPPSDDGRAAPAADAMASCPVHDLRARLRAAGLRPTRQRIALGWILLASGHRHVTAEGLYEEAKRARVRLSLATVYNTLNQFTEIGILREIAVDGSKTYFDTNTTHHHHFLIDGRLADISADLGVSGVPAPPDGLVVERVDIVVRLKPATRA